MSNNSAGIKAIYPDVQSALSSSWPWPNPKKKSFGSLPPTFWRFWRAEGCLRWTILGSLSGWWRGWCRTPAPRFIKNWRWTITRWINLHFSFESAFLKAAQIQIRGWHTTCFAMKPCILSIVLSMNLRNMLRNALQTRAWAILRGQPGGQLWRVKACMAWMALKWIDEKDYRPNKAMRWARLRSLRSCTELT